MKYIPLIIENGIVNEHFGKTRNRVYILCIDDRGYFLRSDYIPLGEMQHVLAALTPANRLVCEVSLMTGLRLGDVLNMRSARLAERMTIRELKTGKSRRVRIPVELLNRMHAIKGKIYVFEGRTDPKKHRSRAAVYKDIKRAAKLFRLDKRLQVSPHSLRKIWSVEQLRRHGGNIHKVQELLQHENEAVTMLYAMADALTAAKLSKRG